MSQINDALKRAQDIQNKTSPSRVAPLLPVENRATPPVVPWLWPVMIGLLLLFAAGLIIAVSPGIHPGQNIASSPPPAPAPLPHIQPIPAPPPPAPVAVAAALPPPTRVQGIVYDPAHPYAIVSGKTVFVGDAVDGKLVAAISSDSLTLVGDGQTNQLHLGGH